MTRKKQSVFSYAELLSPVLPIIYRNHGRKDTEFLQYSRGRQRPNSDPFPGEIVGSGGRLRLHRKGAILCPRAVHLRVIAAVLTKLPNLISFPLPSFPLLYISTANFLLVVVLLSQTTFSSQPSSQLGENAGWE